MKVLLRSVLCVMAGAVLMAAVAGEAAQVEKKKKGVKAAGVITNVDAESLTIKSAAKKKKDDVVTPAKETTFKLTADTKVEKSGAKKDDPTTPAAAADLKVGQSVQVEATAANVATRVLIVQKKKKKDAN